MPKCIRVLAACDASHSLPPKQVRTSSTAGGYVQMRAETWASFLFYLRRISQSVRSSATTLSITLLRVTGACVWFSRARIMARTSPLVQLWRSLARLHSNANHKVTVPRLLADIEAQLAVPALLQHPLQAGVHRTSPAASKTHLHSLSSQPWDPRQWRQFTSSTGQDDPGTSQAESTASESPGSGGAALGRMEPRLAMVFTCTKCETRSAKTFSRRSYTHGLVLVRCPGCNKLHLVADHLGWFGQKGWTIEDLQEEAGVRMKVFRDPTSHPGTSHPVGGLGASGGVSNPSGLSPQPEDWVGWSRVEALLAVAQEQRTGEQTPEAVGEGEADVNKSEYDKEVWEVGPNDLAVWRKVRGGQGTTDAS